MGHDTIAAVPALLNHRLLVMLLQLERGGHAQSFKLHHPSKTRAPTGPQRGFMHMQHAFDATLGCYGILHRMESRTKGGEILVCALQTCERDSILLNRIYPRELYLEPRHILSADCVISHLAFLFLHAN